MNEQISRKDLISALLLSFNVSFYDFQEVQGATVTLYKFRPKIGVRVSKIRGLKDELAAALHVPSVRIIAPMDDGSVGIEVPNKAREIIPVASLFQSWGYENTPMELPCAIGHTVTNEIFMADLTEMPHLLVAGATGQGKSVGLNVIIMSLLKKKSPDELKLILIDPKQVEFSIYSSLENSYLAAPVITDAGEAISKLQTVCDIMDERYELLSSIGVRNIKEYNASPIVERLPYIVVVIDEFADIMLTSRTNKALLEEYICRIAQKARAVGIHVIISTQRPSTEFVTGCVKANFPARIAFRTTTSIDSRVIFGQSGAEKLTGRGDMLFFCGSETIRMQCAYASMSDVRSLCEELNERYADYDNEPIFKDKPVSPDYNLGYMRQPQLSEPLLESTKTVVMLVVEQEEISEPWLQYRAHLSFLESRRVFNQLKQLGIIDFERIRGATRMKVLVRDKNKALQLIERASKAFDSTPQTCTTR